MEIKKGASDSWLIFLKQERPQTFDEPDDEQHSQSPTETIIIQVHISMNAAKHSEYKI